MTDKIDFPTGVELPLRGGAVAVLYEFYKGRWYGRSFMPGSAQWEGECWHANGEFDRDDSDKRYDILPPKRKAWVVWGPDGLPDVFTSYEAACQSLLGVECRKDGKPGDIICTVNGRFVLDRISEP
jgi:hypothetical protein